MGMGLHKIPSTRNNLRTIQTQRDAVTKRSSACDNRGSKSDRSRIARWRNDGKNSVTS